MPHDNATEDTDEILLERRDGVALVTMNRPKALNALTLRMYRTLDPDLLAWGRDPDVRCVVIRGAGGKAFCAGGDVRAIWETGQGIKGPDDPKRVFFREEYRLIQRVHRFPKPYVALMDGITMGGGCGMSLNGSHRVATGKTLIAMPETAIGLFPDVGATRFLNRCPGRLGRYLGLTGARLKAADALYCGLATHCVPSERLEDVIAALSAIRWETGRERRQVDAALARFQADPGPAPLAEHRDAIDRCFAGASVEAIVDALGHEGTEWAKATRDTLLRVSPTSLKVTLRQLETGADSIEEALILEYRLTQHMMEHPDFFEGVRAALVDKDQAPKWKPPTLAGVGEDLVEAHFRPIGEHELTFVDA
jgi:enoyl-CoA hydratase/carnithine racemase